MLSTPCRFFSAFLLVTSAWSLGTSAKAQDVRAALGRVEEAFQQGNGRNLLAGAADRLEIAVLEAPSFYSRAQAMYVMENFFRTYPPKQFDIQDADPSEESLYAPGLYWSTSQSEPFRVYVRLRRMAQQWELREIRIEQRDP
ncbi:MAG: DUF4783 domain-containing protein [Rhodothermales bacterium]